MTATPADGADAVDDGADLLRRFATFAGDLHGDVTQRVPPIVAMTSQEREQTALAGLAELRAHEVLTDGEVDHLTTVVRSLHADATTPRERATQVAAIHEDLITTNAAPLAVSISGIALNSSLALAKIVDEAPQGANIGDVSTVGECATVGAIVGATAGLVGGPIGVLGGAAAGAAGGAIGFFIAQALKA